MRTLSKLLLCALAAGSARPAVAQSAAGAEAFDFLLFDANARPVALGGAYTALATDANALLYNPAGLGRVHNHEATFMHNQNVPGLTQEYLAFAAKQGWGMNVNVLSLAGINRTTFAQPGGGGDTVAMSDLALGGGYGLLVSPDLCVGGGIKYIRETLDNVTANGFAFDGGALYSIAAVPGLTLGAAVENIGPDVKFLNAGEKLPLYFRTGAAYSFDALGNASTFALDLTKERTDSLRFGLGAETILAEAMALRVGFTTRNDTDVGLTGGIGWFGDTWPGKSFAVDYAVVPMGDLGLTHRISVTFRWGGGAEAKRPYSRETTVEESRETAANNARAASSVAALDGENPEKHFADVESLIAAKSYAKAREELSTVDKLLAAEDRRRVLYFERMGAIALRENDFLQAKSFYAHALKLAASLAFNGSGVADAYAGMGVCLAHEKDIPNALKFFEKALEAEPSPETRRFVDGQMTELKHAKLPTDAR